MTNPIAVIPARAGSKRLPGKNGRYLGDHQLWAWSAYWAEKAGCTVVVSTDSEDIATANEQLYGHHLIRRPPEHCTDNAPLDEAVDWTLRTFRNRYPELWDDRIILLQPTSPFRSSKDIVNAVALLDRYDSVVGVVRDSGAYFRWGDDGRLYEARPRTQNIRLWREPGALYAFRWSVFCTTGNRVCGSTTRLEMPPLAGIDIDDEHDWVVAEALATARPELSPWHTEPTFTTLDGVELDSDFATALRKEMRESCGSTGHYRVTWVSDDTDEASDLEWADREIASLRRRLDEMTRERDVVAMVARAAAEWRDLRYSGRSSPLATDKDLAAAVDSWRGDT